MSELPQPPVPIDADLRHFPNMPLEVGRLRDSDIASVGDPEVFRCAVLLWCAAWHQIPAGSLPDDDPTLARLAGLGRDVKTWKRLRLDVLRGFKQFADGRLYHRVVCEKVIEGLNSTLLHDWNKACARLRKENHRRSQQSPKLPKLVTPDRPEPIALNWPDAEGTRMVRAPEREPCAGVRVPEREYGSERKGRESFPRGAPDGLPLGTVPETSSPVAARGSLGGSAHDGEVVQLINRVAAAKTMQP